MYSEAAMKELQWEQTRQMLLFVTDQIEASKPLLTEVDSQIGDGDHGIGMALGMQKAREKLQNMAVGQNVFTLYLEMGKAMLQSMGGASGVIFGTFFMGGAMGKEAQTLTCAGVTAWASDSLLKIQARGKAQVGDKTMVDALSPAVDAMREYTGEDLTALLRLAEAGARDGVEASKAYMAKFGRAKSLMERAIGYQDAGATSTWLIFSAMRTYCEQVDAT